jgi:hypothetical protein
MPTFCAFAGIPVPGDIELDGLDISAVLTRGAPSPDQEIECLIMKRGALSATNGTELQFILQYIAGMQRSIGPDFFAFGIN